MGDDEGGGHDLEAEDSFERCGAETVGNAPVVFAGLFEQGAVDALEDGGEVGSGAAAGVEDADVRGGEAERLVELSAEELVDTLDM